MEALDPGQGDHDVSWVDLSEEERFNAAKTKTLNPCKKNYCSPKGELLALMHGLKKFAHVLACQHHTMVLDNLGIINLQMGKLDKNAILSRWINVFSKFDFDVLYLPDKELIPAELLILKEIEDFVPVNY